MSEKLKIAPLVGSSLLTLKHLTADLKGHGGPQASLVNSSLARFKLWSASSGASRVRGTRSLEYKVRDALSLRNHVISLLKDLWDAADEARRSLTDDFSSGQDEERPFLVVDDLAQYFSKNIGPEISVFDEFLDDIKRIVDRLLRLTVVFKNPTPHEQVLPMHADNLINHVSHVQIKFPGIPDYLAERLGGMFSKISNHTSAYRTVAPRQTDLEEFEEHTTSKHKYEVSRQHLDGLLELCCVPDPTKACGRCILCNHQLASDKLHISHVASHLEQLALHPLPLLDYDHDQNIDGCVEVDNQIDDDKSSNTNGESEEEESDQGQVNTDDNDEYAVYEESAGGKEDPEDIPAQSGWSISFNIKMLQGSATTVFKAYVDPQISKLLVDKWGSYHGLVSEDLIRSHEKHGHQFILKEKLDDQYLFEYKGTYVRGIGRIKWVWYEDVPRPSEELTFVHLLICSDLPGGINIIVKDKPGGNCTVKSVSVTDTKAKSRLRIKSKTLWYCVSSPFNPTNMFSRHLTGFDSLIADMAPCVMTGTNFVQVVSTGDVLCVKLLPSTMTLEAT
ncbi:hypothetical protein NEUTE1DRAFT_133803 [Neurospora tetrasperma FGSC 2508]|uniref:C2H2-type domain-containing protein n=1 Tax=Neurospora tetrasperma (strain FGSC 2508 / ATCC MYA-4615 / P0657) TaxID=510951 RepID=F8N395_NEUT8|nr:uncharacterized protein NEUTE1DRAFT_133803 [Neurospora tetrasperma FGSC 2508]EGO53402.1 hypothetical protein NEUTE1DRAFT_133803 [Neurospora tetrasperma FGSC 2508]